MNGENDHHGIYTGFNFNKVKDHCGIYIYIYWCQFQWRTISVVTMCLIQILLECQYNLIILTMIFFVNYRTWPFHIPSHCSYNLLKVTSIWLKSDLSVTPLYWYVMSPSWHGRSEVTPLRVTYDWPYVMNIRLWPFYQQLSWTVMYICDNLEYQVSIWHFDGKCIIN